LRNLNNKKCQFLYYLIPIAQKVFNIFNMFLCLTLCESHTVSLISKIVESMLTYT
jgi:hypothetical protein